MVPVIQQRSLLGSEVRSSLLMPFFASFGSKPEPEKNTTRFGSVPLVVEQKLLSQIVNASASAKWNGMSLRAR